MVTPGGSQLTGQEPRSFVDSADGQRVGPAESASKAGPGRRVASAIAFVCLLAAIAWTAWVYGQVRYYATHDQSRPADAIAIFGAAEYDGRPSPVLRSRLDHGLDLYREKLAPLVITLGGGGATDRHSEGSVGHDYLLAHGVPEAAIIAETHSSNTHQSSERLAVIARANNLRRLVVVSDGTHLFRIHALCERAGLEVYTSPRRELYPLTFTQQAKRTMHEILSYTAFRLHLH